MKNTTYFLWKTILFSLFTLVISCQNIEHTEKKTPDKSQENIIFIGTYTQKEAHVDGQGEGIYVYKLNPQTGELTYLNKVIDVINPSYLIPHPSKNLLYSVNEIGGKEGTISAFLVNPDTYSLQLLNKVSSNGIAPCYLSTNANGQYVLVANYVTGNIGMHPIENDGKIGEAISVIHHGKSNSKHPRQKSAHAHYIAPNKEGNLAYAVDLGLDKILSYQIDTINNGLLPANTYKTTSKQAGARHLAWHPFQSWFYVINELNGSIEAFKETVADSSFTHFQTISTLTDKNSIAHSADIHLTPNGRYLYASNRGTHNNIAMYQVDEKDGNLTLLGHQSSKGIAPRNFLISPNGKFLLVANQDSDNVVTFKINEKTGILEETGMEIQVKTPVCLKAVVY